MDSVILGISQAITLICQAVFFIMTSVTALEFINNTAVWFGDRIGVENMTVEVCIGDLYLLQLHMTSSHS